LKNFSTDAISETYVSKKERLEKIDETGRIYRKILVKPLYSNKASWLNFLSNILSILQQ
jgi:hypothetical protein